MDIISRGIGIKKFVPEIIHLNFDFRIKSFTYENALSEGVKAVETFAKLLEKLGYKKSDFKTNSRLGFVILKFFCSYKSFFEHLHSLLRIV